MKKRTISKLKSLFSSKKGKRQQQQHSSKSSRSPSPEPAGAASPVPAVNGESFRPLLRTPPPSRVGPPPSPPVPTHPVAPVAPEPAAPQPLMPCQVCGRTFVPQSLAKHVKICEKMTIKKRKTFDSSRQRREGLTAANGANSGTDLEQYLPKNFGLPENSPFLEKSPPPTAKPTPKPKPQSVRSAITKPMAELQRCPHCKRAFGMRAFERHVEWCGDKAKILPAAPAAPPQHIADAKQRLNARTQYKAPPVRGRRSSQTRDKSSNSRSASVESSRGVSPPPPPREYGDYKHGRARASESASSNDCHEDTSPHVPVIRNSRNMQNSSSGDANVKARQARLARDLSSSRKVQDPRPTSVQQSSTDPNIKQSKQKKMNPKKQQQLNKLEQLANKYKDKMEESKEDKKEQLKKIADKSQIPIPKKVSLKKLEGNWNRNVPIKKQDQEVHNSPSTSADKSKTISLKAPSEVSVVKKNDIPDKEKKTKRKVRRDTKKIVKENSMSVDSLEECPPNSNRSNNERNCQSIGINTELLCVPCVIHDNVDQKKENITQKKVAKKTNKNPMKDFCEPDEPKVELLYKNPTIVNSNMNDRTVPYIKEDFSNSNFISPSTSGNFMSDEVESAVDLNHCQTLETTNNLKATHLESRHTDMTYENDGINQLDAKSANNTIYEVQELPEKRYQNDYEPIEEEIHSLSQERFEENYEHDVSAELSNDSIEQRYVEDNANELNEIECRHGSGETYTKFTEDPADLQEFMNFTDKLLNNDINEEESCNVDKELDNFHTPKTSSIEAINSQDIQIAEPAKHYFSETFEELKSNFKEIMLQNSNNVESETLKKTDKVADNDTDENVCEASREVHDMEHITVYKLKFYEQKIEENKSIEEVIPQFRLPSISETTTPGRRVECSKKKMQNIYKSNRKYKMLGEQTRSNKEYQTFIVKQNVDNSDAQSVCSDAPPLKLPRIEKKSSNNIVSESLFPSSVKRSTSLLDSIQKKNVLKMDSGRSRHKSDQLEQDIMQSLKDFDKFYENEKSENLPNKETTNYNGTAKRVKSEKKTKRSTENLTNGNHTPNGKASNDSAYSRLVSLNRISPSKLSICTSKEPNGLTSLEQIPAGSDSSGSHKEDARSISSDEFLAMERSAELDEPLPPPEPPHKEQDTHVKEKRVSSRGSRGSGGWRASGSLSSSGSEASLHRGRQAPAAPRLSRFCHECGNRFPVDSAKFCIECGVKRLVV
ncbi:uncharacterized protein LOC142979544 isoform X8 [Anticarsia gemmatalis]|uniref:uncharacterized protein LOC142979544 isoform X8 n=1 Tax=Anticarsia gemmatalis TaxID=129554 RepID=UPI003F76B253